MREPKVVRSIAFIDSIHVGSRFAVFPPDFIPKDDDTPKKLNRVQKTLLKYWISFWEECDYANVDTVICLGEFIDGISRFEQGKDQTLTDLNEQKRAAIQLMEPHVKKRKLRGVSGSLYHIAADTFDLDKDIIESLGGSHSGWVAHYKFNPCSKIFSVSHSISTTITAHDATILSKEISATKEAEALGRLPKGVNQVDVIVKGHAHKWLSIHEKQMAAFVVPGWKVFHVIKGRTNYWPKRIPIIGGVIVRITEDDKLRIWPEIFDTPHEMGLLEEL